MSVLDNRSKEFKECKSFSELTKVCERYSYLFETFADEVRNKLYELPAEFNEDFIRFLLKAYHIDNDLTEDNLRATYVSFLRDYSNKVVNGGLLKEPGIKSQFIPVVIFSATNHDQIHISYLIDACHVHPDFIKKVFYDHNYELNSSFDDNDDVKDYREEMRIIDILTSQAAYEDFIYQFSTDLDKKEGLEYLMLRSKKIYEQFIAHNDYVDANKISVMYIYHFLTYLITTIEQNQDYLNSTSHRLVFESAIRNIYDSIDMILLYISIPMNKQEYEKFPEIAFKVAEEVKYYVIKAIIDEAFLYMHRYLNQLNKREDIKKYFDIRYDDKHNVTSYRVIPDTNLVFLNKDSSPIATEAYDKNSSKMDQASRKIYAGYKAYKDAENKVDSQITKLIMRIKNVFTGGKTARDRIIEGEQFSAIKILKKLLTTAAIFSYSKIAGVLFVITRHYCSKAADAKERKRLISELELEIKLLDEKIDDARGDGNRQAKYSMMRTRAELQKALEQIKYGLAADKKALNTAKAVATGRKSLAYDGPMNNSDDE